MKRRPRNSEQLREEVAEEAATTEEKSKSPESVDAEEEAHVPPRLEEVGAQPELQARAPALEAVDQPVAQNPLEDPRVAQPHRRELEQRVEQFAPLPP